MYKLIDMKTGIIIDTADSLAEAQTLQAIYGECAVIW